MFTLYVRIVDTVFDISHFASPFFIYLPQLSLENVDGNHDAAAGVDRFLG